jgi:hypothetical protein
MGVKANFPKKNIKKRTSTGHKYISNMITLNVIELSFDVFDCCMLDQCQILYIGPHLTYVC